MSSSVRMKGCVVKTVSSLQGIVPLKSIEYGVYGDLVIIYPKPYSVYLQGILLARTTFDSEQHPDAETYPRASH